MIRRVGRFVAVAFVSGFRTTHAGCAPVQRTAAVPRLGVTEVRAPSVRPAALVALGSLILAAVAVAALAVPAMASSRRLVVVDRSMAGVRLGTSPATVRQKLGKPESRSKCGSSEMDKALCGGPGVTMWRYMKGKLSVTFIKKRVVRLSTTSSKLRTRSGIGVGVPFSRVLKRYPNGTAGGRPSFKWYYLGAVPTDTGDIYTLASDANGTLTGKVRDFDIGRFDSAHHCAFFSDVPECA